MSIVYTLPLFALVFVNIFSVNIRHTFQNKKIKLRCKCISDNKVSSVSSFSRIWHDEICTQLQDKYSLFIRDAKATVIFAYSDLISVLIALRKSP